MTIERLSLVGADNTPRSLAVGEQTTINLYPELTEDPQAKQKGLGSLYGCPGRHLLRNYGANTSILAIWSGAGRLFVIQADGAGNTYEVEVGPSGADISRHLITTVFTGAPGVILANGNQLLLITAGLVFCDNGAGPVQCFFDNFYGIVDTAGTAVTLDYTTAGSALSGFLTDGSWDATATPITINAVSYTIDHVVDSNHLVLTGTAGTQTSVSASVIGTDPVTATTGAYLDGYFIVQRPRGGSPDLGRQINISSILDGLTWSSLDFTTAEAEPSYIRGLTVDNEQLYVWKDASFQVYQNTGGGVGGFPLSNLEGAMAKFGSISAFGNGSLGGQVYFLGSDGTGWISAYRLNGFTPVRISGHPQEERWNSEGVGTGAQSYFYSEEGHSFWVITFGSTEASVFDPESGAWHQRFGWNGSSFTSYDTFAHAFVEGTGWDLAGDHIVVGATSLYKSSVNFYDNAGSDIGWQRTLPYVYQGGTRTYFGRMWMELETGTVASGAAPTVSRSYSDDRGVTFSTPETASIGTHGQSAIQVYWPNGGSCDGMGRIWRFAGSGKYKVALIDLQVEITRGTT